MTRHFALEKTAQAEKARTVEKLTDEKLLSKHFLALCNECAKGVFVGLVETSIEKAFRDVLKLGGTIFYVMDDRREKVIGFTTSFVSAVKKSNLSLLRNQNAVFFESVVVAKSERRKGIFRQLAREMVGDSIAEKRKFMLVETQSPATDSTIRDVLDEQKKSGRIQSYTVSYEVMNQGHPITFEAPVQSGKKDLDEKYKKTLNVQNGDFFRVVFHVLYPENK